MTDHPDLTNGTEAAGSSGSGRAEIGARSTLAASAASGVRWGLVYTASQQILRVLFTIALARIIGPEDFGIVAQATIYLGFTQLFLDSGFGSALIQKRELEPIDIGSVVWLNICVGSLAVVATIVAAPFVADFFHTPELEQVLRVLSVLVMLNALTVVPMSLLNRRMGWRPIALTQLFANVVGGIGGIAAALGGLGYWAVVVQNITIGFLTLVGLLLATGVPPLRGSFTRLRQLFSFAWGLFGARMFRFGGENIDNILIGRYLGAAELAFYALSYRLLKLPIQLVGQIVNQVSLPAFSRMHDDAARLQRWFLTSTRTVATGGYPFLVLGIVAAPDVIPLLFGEEWKPAVVPTQILIAVSMRSLILMLTGPLFTALGKTRELFGWTVVNVVVTVIGIVIGLQWGIVGVATGVAVATYAVTPLNVSVAARLIGFRGREYGRALSPAWIASGAMVLAWFPVRLACAAGEFPVVPSVILAATAASATYLAVLWFGFRDSFDAMREVGSLLLPGRRGPVVAETSA